MLHKPEGWATEAFRFKVADHVYMSFISSPNDNHEDIYIREKSNWLPWRKKQSSSDWEQLQDFVQWHFGVRVRLYHAGSRHPVELKREKYEREHPAISGVAATGSGLPVPPDWNALIPHIPAIVDEVLRAITSSGAALAVYKVVDLWVQYRNGRKVKIKLADIEIELTQMKPQDALRLLEALQEKADRKKIRELLLKASGLQAPESH